MMKIAFKEHQHQKMLLAKAGEYLVASQLCLLGYSVSFPQETIPGVDLLVHNLKTGKTVMIQVKTKMGFISEAKNRRIGDYILPKDPKGIRNAFVFVWFEESDGNPRFYVVPPQDLIEISEKGLKDYLSTHQASKPDKQPRIINISQLERYQDAWEKLGF